MSDRNELVRIKRIGPPLLTDVVPVRYETCGICGGDGWVEMRVDGDGIGHGRTCAYCNGKGTIAVEVTP